MASLMTSLLRVIGLAVPSRGDRQAEGEGGPLAGAAGHVDLAAVGRDDLAGDRQAEPGPAAAASPGTR